MININPDERQTKDSSPMAGNVDGQYVTVISKGAGIQVNVSHQLRRTPFGGLLAASGGGILYSPGGLQTPYKCKPWTDKEAFFVPLTVAGTEYRILLV